MKNKKLTDSEIKKALECCSKKNCKQCPNFSEDIECSEKLINLTLDLITRQQAKIDEFMKETAVTTLIDDAVVYTPTLEDYNKFKKKFKSEAFKDVLGKVRIARNQSLINKTSAYKFEKILEKMVTENNG